MRNSRFTKVLAVAAATMLGLSACGGGDDTASGDGGEVKMTFWHNSTTGQGKEFWDNAAADFTAEHPNVTIDVQAIQNEELDGRLQTAMNSGDAPDGFLARGGGKLQDMVDAGQVQDITDQITDDTKAVIPESAFAALTIDGKVYGVPTAVLPGGIFYSMDLFEQAGIAETPKTMDELNDAVDKLKAAGIDPIALGAKDAWPAAHWYYFFALRTCSQDVLQNSSVQGDFSDPCWLEAGQELEDFTATEPFNSGFLTTSAQQGAGSSAGLVANHKAAMELMGAWNVGVIGDLTPNQEPLPDLGWFPFPAVEGAGGSQTAMMGGLDAFACSAEAPPECAQFLNFVSQTPYQEKYAEAFSTLPANTEAQSVVAEPALQDILDSYNNADYVVVWLDTLLGQNIGNALNIGVVDMLAGRGSAQGIIDAVESASARG